MTDAARVGTAFVDIQGDFSSINKQVAAFSSRLGKAGKLAGGLGLVGAGAVVLGKQLYDIGAEFDKATDKIRVGTGKTGKQLKGLQRDFKAVVSGVPADFGDAGDAISEINRRLGLTGKPLRNLSKQFLELSNVTDTDLQGNIQTVTRLFGDWSIKTKDQPKTLDKLFRASQATGIEVGKLSDYMVQFGSPLRQMGFDFDTAAAMFSKFEKEGVNLQTAMPGLRMALKNFASEGKDPATALQATITKIKEAASAAKANTMAFDIFGTRAGPDLAAAIREGRFDFDKLIGTIRGGGDTIRKAGKETRDFTEHWELFKQRVMVKLEPLASRVFDKLGDSMERVGDILTDPKLSNEEKFSQIFDMLADAGSDAISEISSKAGQFAPKAAAAFVKGFTEADTWGKLAIGAFLLTKFGGKGGLMASGASIGRWLGLGIASGAVTSAAGGAGTGAGGAAAGGIAGGLMSKLRGIKWGRVGGLGLGLWAADEAISEFQNRSNERSDDIETALGSIGKRGFMATSAQFASGFVGNKDANEEESKAKQILSRYRELKDTRIRMTANGVRELSQKARELDLTTEQREQVARMVNLLSRGQSLKTKVDLGMDPAKLRQIQQGFTFLRNGVGTSMADINKVTKRTGRLIAHTFGKDTKEGRKLTADNMKATAAAIAQQMDRSGKFTKEGMQRIKGLIRNADLVAPSRKQARAFGQEWAKGMSHSKDITREGIDDMIREAQKMPGPMRQIALRTWLNQAKEAKRSGDITVGELRRMRSRVLSEFGGIQKGSKEKSRDMAEGVVGSFDNLVKRTAGSLGNFRSVVNASLVAFGAKPLQFSIGKETKRQLGGIVPGQGDGDKFRTAVPAGTFILNREAIAAFGFNKGGLVPVALEAGEGVIPPEEVQAIGRRKLEAANAAVPRKGFQVGGNVGLGPEPRLMGMDPLRELGQRALHMVYEGGQEYLRKHMKAVSGGDLVEVGHSLQRLGYEVSEHPAFGGVTAGAHVSDSAHYDDRAVDVNDDAPPFGHGTDEMSSLDWLAPQLMKLPHSQIIWRNHDLETGAPISGHMDHLHFAMMLGGLVQELATGGFAKGSYTVKHHAASAAQMKVAEEILTGGDRTGANHLARVASMMAGIQESELGALDSNVFQLTGAKSGTSPGAGALDQALAWFTEGFYGKGGGIALSKTMNDPGAIAQAVEGSKFPSAYSPWKGEARGWVDGWGGGGPSSPDDIPNLVKGSTKGGATSKGGGTIAPGHYKVTTDTLNDFGSLPANIAACTKELRVRQRELGEYRAAAAHTKDSEVKKALLKNANLLQKRIGALRKQRRRLILEAMTKKKVAKIKQAANFEAWTTPNTGIFARMQAAFELAQERADETVALEPEVPTSGATAGWVDSVLKPYVEGSESSAFARVLGTEGSRRNAFIGAEQFAENKTEQWRVDIERLQNEIAFIRGLKDSNPKAYAKNKDRIPGMQERMKALRSNIVQTRTTTLPEWEEELSGVQGHGRPHDIRPSLPGLPTGEFGGDVFQTQLQIKELGLKVPEALAGLVSDTDSGKAEREALLEGLLRDANQEVAVASAQRVALQGWDAMRQGFAGTFAKGGTIPPGKWGIAGETGRPEIIEGPATVRSPGESAAMMGGGGLSVAVNGDINQRPGDMRSPIEVRDAEGNLIDAVLSATGTGRRHPGIRWTRP